MTCCSFTSWPCFSTRSAFSLSKSTGGSDSPGLLSRPCCPFRIYGDKEEKFIKGLWQGIQLLDFNAVNQLLFATNFFHKLLYINWFALTSFCNQAFSSTPVMLRHPLSKDWILPSDIHDEKSLANLVKMSLARIKFCSQNCIVSI